MYTSIQILKVYTSIPVIQKTKMAGCIQIIKTYTIKYIQLNYYYTSTSTNTIVHLIHYIFTLHFYHYTIAHYTLTVYFHACISTGINNQIHWKIHVLRFMVLIYYYTSIHISSLFIVVFYCHKYTHISALIYGYIPVFIY